MRAAFCEHRCSKVAFAKAELADLVKSERFAADLPTLLRAAQPDKRTPTNPHAVPDTTSHRLPECGGVRPRGVSGQLPDRGRVQVIFLMFRSSKCIWHCTLGWHRDDPKRVTKCSASMQVNPHFVGWAVGDVQKLLGSPRPDSEEYMALPLRDETSARRETGQGVEI